ncbi:DNA replication licensing factor mcm10 [Purpureocillium lavendulum]|uniref:DNA replication licensing factor mcm10 n=1 Tax=Purpureocillium lavendulum TaxID=1247861 RepID=A0AB34FE80_9HYPO|nr:DNA replication licensing factor mcm10 [Purpureocillium lavendulum]
MTIAFGAVTTIILCIRLLYKRFFSTKQRLGIDDWTILLASPIGIPSIAMTIFGLTANGLGEDMWGLQPSSLVAFGLYFYIIEILYVLLMTIVKLSLSFFYLDIFPGRQPDVFFGPLYQWTKHDFKTIPRPQGQCYNINVAGWVNAALTVISDIWLLAIPLTQIKQLNLHWKKKAAAGLMFMTGTM